MASRSFASSTMPFTRDLSAFDTSDKMLAPLISPLLLSNPSDDGLKKRISPFVSRVSTPLEDNETIVCIKVEPGLV